MNLTDYGYLWTAVGIVVLGVLAIWFLFDTAFDAKADRESFIAKCEQAGGHIYKPDMTYFCLTSDGRMLEVYP